MLVQCGKKYHQPKARTGNQFMGASRGTKHTKTNANILDTYPMCEPYPCLAYPCLARLFYLAYWTSVTAIGFLSPSYPFVVKHPASLCGSVAVFFLFWGYTATSVCNRQNYSLMHFCFALAFSRLHKTFTTNRGRPYTDTLLHLSHLQEYWNPNNP